jgi:FdhE protein
VAAGFIRKLLGHPPDLPREVSDALAELTAIAEQRPSLAELAAELKDVFLALYAEPIHERAPVIDSDKAAGKLVGGMPLLRNENVSIDSAAFGRRWQQVTDALKKRRPDASPALATALRQGKLDPAWLGAEVLTGQTQAIHERAEALGLDVPLTATVVWLTLFPAFSQIRAGLDPLLGSTRWKEGYCPCCGSWPKLGEFRGLEQIRFLRCGLCAAEWEFARLRCPFCGVTDHRQLGYLHVEGEEGKYRAATCDECRQYVKMQSTLTALSAPQLLVADLATMHLDLAAADQGYSQPV